MILYQRACRIAMLFLCPLLCATTFGQSFTGPLQTSSANAWMPGSTVVPAEDTIDNAVDNAFQPSQRPPVLYGMPLQDPASLPAAEPEAPVVYGVPLSEPPPAYQSPTIYSEAPPVYQSPTMYQPPMVHESTPVYESPTVFEAPTSSGLNAFYPTTSEREVYETSYVGPSKWSGSFRSMLLRRIDNRVASVGFPWRLGDELNPGFQLTLAHKGRGFLPKANGWEVSYFRVAGEERAGGNGLLDYDHAIDSVAVNSIYPRSDVRSYYLGARYLRLTDSVFSVNDFNGTNSMKSSNDLFGIQFGERLRFHCNGFEFGLDYTTGAMYNSIRADRGSQLFANGRTVRDNLSGSDDCFSTFFEGSLETRYRPSATSYFAVGMQGLYVSNTFDILHSPKEPNGEWRDSKFLGFYTRFALGF